MEQPKLATWAIVRFTPTVVIGHVEAEDAESAIKKAIGFFHIADPEQQKRLVARRVR
jgi:hypothetical protein